MAKSYWQRGQWHLPSQTRLAELNACGARLLSVGSSAARGRWPRWDRAVVSLWAHIVVMVRVISSLRAVSTRRARQTIWRCYHAELVVVRSPWAFILIYHASSSRAIRSFAAEQVWCRVATGSLQAVVALWAVCAMCGICKAGRTAVSSGWTGVCRGGPCSAVVAQTANARWWVRLGAPFAAEVPSIAVGAWVWSRSAVGPHTTDHGAGCLNWALVPCWALRAWALRSQTVVACGTRCPCCVSCGTLFPGRTLRAGCFACQCVVPWGALELSIGVYARAGVPLRTLHACSTTAFAVVARGTQILGVGSCGGALIPEDSNQNHYHSLRSEVHGWIKTRNLGQNKSWEEMYFFFSPVKGLGSVRA